MIPLLARSPEKNICFINIAGGAASDSINALFIIQQENPALLNNRTIQINVLDIDTYGPAFADRCIAALKAPGNRFNELNISFKHIHYDWNSTVKLEELLSERKEWLQICSSEGGLFEYCSDEVITQNLNTIYNNSTDDIVIAGSLLHDIKIVDAGIIAALKISTSIKPRFLGLEGLKSIINKNKWKLDSLIKGNPRYLIFALKKESLK
jgi:AAA+ ATPase superfamily predicted ATPase